MAKNGSGWGPRGYLGAGALICVLGAVLAGFCLAGGMMFLGIFVFALLGIVGGVLLLIGAIAKGVQAGRQKPTSAIDPADAR